MASQVNFTKHCKNLTPLLLKLIKFKRREGSKAHFTNIILILKPEKGNTKEENDMPKSLRNMYTKILNKILTNKMEYKNHMIISNDAEKSLDNSGPIYHKNF